jgi:outer membrane protein assembly factor BamB
MRFSGSRAALFLWGFVFALATAQADDWPQWLGPQRDSVWRETGIVAKLPAGGPTVKWRQKIDGGFAGPAVAAGRVFVPDYVTAGDRTPNPDMRNRLQGKERILCFAADDGHLLWKHEYDCTYHVSFPAGPRVTPTVDEGRVYTLGTMGHLCCLNAETGALIWSRDLKRDYQRETPPWGFSGHPLVDGDRLVCVVGGQGSVAVALDKLTGREVWRSLSAKEPGYCAPTMITVGGVRQLLIWHTEALVGLNPDTGAPLWSVPLSPDYGMAIATPRQQGGLVFVGAIKNKSMLVKVSGGDKPAAELVWQGTARRGIGPVFAPPFLQDQFLYGIDRGGELRCVQLSDGERRWSTYAATTGGRPADSSPAFIVQNGDRFFLANEKGELIIARISPQGYEELSRCQIIEPTSDGLGRRVIWSHPAFANRCVYARNDKEVLCVSLAAP